MLSSCLHDSNWQSFKLAVHKDVDRIQNNIGKLYNIAVNLQHNSKKT